ncbi:hypothetical protein RhiirA1_451303 [Rhizophagus irregularis]|uniref:Uncharacterized protein n=1 Tax=Rhizophagus irregularis TaxID=588596 RepID=A0A2I1EL34_9GLOM|nr:hypothetical protein RhiirA1_451303 [Rhizophagus irregularis]PKY22825.1 hypothetical protein RhiirB3_436867 [Rhizophagus irregularis]
MSSNATNLVRRHGNISHITGIFQTISELEPVIYKCLEHLQNSFKDELQELDDTLAFKIIQDRECRKLIRYSNIWASLNKTFNTEFNFKEFKGVCTRYFSSTLNWSRNKPPKKTDSTQNSEAELKQESEYFAKELR